MNLITFFNLRLGIVERSGYARAVSFPLSLVGASSGGAWTGGSGPHRSMTHPPKKRQVHRTNRVVESPNPFLPPWGES